MWHFPSFESSLPGLGCHSCFRRQKILNKAHPLAHRTVSYCWIGLLPSGILYWLSSRLAAPKVFEHLQLLPNGIWQPSSLCDRRSVHFSVLLVKLVLILFLFSENTSGFWLQGRNCVNGCCEHPAHDTPHGVLLCLEIPVGRSRRFILFSRWTAEFMRQLSAILPPFSCISIKEALVIIVQRHYSPFLQRQLRAIQAKNSIRISQLNHLVSACFAGIISSSLSSSACCLEMHSLL